MHFLVLCTKYSLSKDSPYLTNDLADALVRAGHRVTVVATEWGQASNIEPRLEKTGSLTVLSLSPVSLSSNPKLRLLSKWVLSSFAARRMITKHLAQEPYDAVVAFTPCVTIAAQIAWLRRRTSAKLFLYIHDFFPFHHRSIGLVPDGPVFKLALSAERWLIRKFDFIGCMLTDNITYLRRNYPLHRDQTVLLAPLWTRVEKVPQIDKVAMRERHNLPRDSQIIVFGGQLTEGRGIEEMLAVARRAEGSSEPLTFLFIGTGRLSGLVDARARISGSNVFHIPGVSRSEYLSIIGACDIGMVATVQGVESSSFPSKTLDYLRAGLPIVAAVERESGYRDFLTEWGLGASVEASDVEGLHRIIIETVEQMTFRDYGATAQRCLAEVFDVDIAAARLVGCIATQRAPLPELHSEGRTDEKQ